jgi:hypothetical protein
MEQPGIARIVFQDQDFRPALRFSQRLVSIHGSGLPRRGNYSIRHCRPFRAGWPTFCIGGIGGAAFSLPTAPNAL